ncbi:hypothetical protein ACFXPA_01105 [Amycolatopsis sp. NPDC059090]
MPARCSSPLAPLDVAKKIVGTAKAMSVQEHGVAIAPRSAKQESRLDTFATVGCSTGTFQRIGPGSGDARADYDRTAAGTEDTIMNLGRGAFLLKIGHELRSSSNASAQRPKPASPKPTQP